MRRQTVSKLIDKVHKAFVYTCIGGTIYGLCLLSLTIGKYYIVVRPQLKEKEEREKELLLQEGRDVGIIIEDAAPDMQL